PPYTSKYNPIEHRLFPHLTRACQGVVFSSVELVKELMSKATTKTGLEVEVTILDKTYETGRKVSEAFKNQMRVIFDDVLPRWNYRVPPLEGNSG
ncbi:transposase, partial [Candidatus Entotheonella serta]